MWFVVLVLLLALGGVAAGCHGSNSQSAGYYHTCAILVGGGVKCWGLGIVGRLGYDSTDDKGDQVGEMAGLGTVNLNASAIAITAGYSHTCAILAGGNVKCWGLGIVGRLGYRQLPIAFSRTLYLSRRHGHRVIPLATRPKLSATCNEQHRVSLWGRSRAALYRQPANEATGRCIDSRQTSTFRRTWTSRPGTCSSCGSFRPQRPRNSELRLCRGRGHGRWRWRRHLARLRVGLGLASKDIGQWLGYG